MLKLLSIFEIETSVLSQDIGTDVKEILISEGFDVIHDDGGCDVLINPRFGTNAKITVFKASVEVQTRCYISLCGDLCGISRKEAELQMQDNLKILKEHFNVLGHVWSIVEQK